MSALVSESQRISFDLLSVPKKAVCIFISEEIAAPRAIVEEIASEDGFVDVYTWFEGPQGLPKKGASFLSKEILAPLFERKKDLFLHLYSLHGWDFKKVVSKIAPTTPLGKAVDAINPIALKCIYASTFFQYCLSVTEGPLYQYVNQVLPNKEWLKDESKKHKPLGMQVGAFFEEKPSLFDSLSKMDVSEAYSQMQYMEGYFLIRRSIERQLAEGHETIKIVFLLPNDERKYYSDFLKEVEPMLESDFRSKLKKAQVLIWFKFFRYGENESCRPYIDKTIGASKVKPSEIDSLLDFAKETGPLDKPRVPRDLYHALQ